MRVVGREVERVFVTASGGRELKDVTNASGK
jgi:hypothetical protein